MCLLATGPDYPDLLDERSCSVPLQSVMTVLERLGRIPRWGPNLLEVVQGTTNSRAQGFSQYT